VEWHELSARRQRPPLVPAISERRMERAAACAKQIFLSQPARGRKEETARRAAEISRAEIEVSNSRRLG